MKETRLYDSAGRPIARISDDGYTKRVYDGISGGLLATVERSGTIFDRDGRVVARATGDLSSVVIPLKEI